MKVKVLVKILYIPWLNKFVKLDVAVEANEQITQTRHRAVLCLIFIGILHYNKVLES